MTTPQTESVSNAASHEDDLAVALRYLKALADQSRLRLLGALAGAERSVEELAALLDLRPPTVSHHLALLRAAGLVAVRAEGVTRLYRLNLHGFEAIARLLAAPERLKALAPEAGDAFERKTLRDFTESGRLRAIPAMRKKRAVILAWLAGQFAPGRAYSEAEVNEILKRHHEDTATLRREMIGYGLLTRANGVYRRPDDPPANT